MANFKSRRKIDDVYFRRMANDMQKQRNENSGKFKTVIIVLSLLFLVSFIFGKIFSDEVGDKVAIIPIEGMIISTSDSLPFASEGVNSRKVVELLNSAEKSKNIKAVILEINSPGGTVVASKEIADSVLNMEKPVVAVIREIGTSGAYWVASASDHIFADEMSLTGSIGVNGGYLEFSGLMDEYGVGYQELKGGKFKDIGNAYEKLTEDERTLLQSKIDIIHENFIKAVAQNRGMEVNDIKKFSEGLYYLGVEAFEIGLIDEYGGMEEAKKKAEELSGFENLEEVRYKTSDKVFSILDLVSTKASYGVGRGIGDSLIKSNVDTKAVIPRA